MPDQQNIEESFRRTQRELSLLYEVSNAMRTTLELKNILYIILTGVTSHTGLGFNRAILFLVDTKNRCLEPQMAIGPESGEHAEKIWNYITSSNQGLDDLIDENKIDQNIAKSALLNSIKDLKIPLDTNPQNLLAAAFHERRPKYITSKEIANYANDAFLKHFKTNELIIMPLKAKNKVIGLIIADNLFTKKPISDDDLKIFNMLANQAGLAIENSRLYEMVIHKSHTDSLTGLWNHGFFQSQLSLILENTLKNEKPLCLLILDIDNFKKLNDNFGHQVGDLVLKNIAQILHESSRENDYACRYGGEEFSVILPETDKEQGMIIAERIRKKVENHTFAEIPDHGALPITVSIGLSCYPQDATTKENLIAQADKAMYIAKFSGKNQTSQTTKED